MSQEIIRIDVDGVNCYLGKQDNKFILFDTGGHLTLEKVFDNRREKLLKELGNLGCTPENLKLIVLTHGDNDHTTNADYIRNKYQVKIAMHSSDLALVANPTIENIMSNFKFNSTSYKIISKIMNKQITKLNNRILNELEKFNPDLYLYEGDSLSEYGFDAKVIHIPGHTQGSIGILTKDGDLIAGDIFANVKKPAPAPNAYDFNKLFGSIKRIKSMPIKMIYPGHGKPFRMEEYRE